VDADGFVIADSAAANAPKKVTGTNLKAYLKSYFDGLYLAFATASGVTTITYGASTLFSVSPGGITTAQTWTLDITETVAASRLYHVFDIMIGVGSSGAAQYGYYKATIAFDRNTLGSTAVIRQTFESIKTIEGTITFTGPTAIADGVRFTIHPTSNTLNRTGAQIDIVPSNGTLTITSTVA